MSIKQLKETLKAKKSYLKKGRQWLADRFECNLEEVDKTLNELKNETSEYRKSTPLGSKTKRQIITYLDKIKIRNPGVDLIPATTFTQTVIRKPYKKGNPDNVLFIGDLHAPFVLDGYLDFNVDLQKKYNAGTIIFAGDVIDSHGWSFHTHDVDGMGVREELRAAIAQLSEWYKAFPEAKILYGNHDLLISRRAKEYGLSQIFLRHLGDILECPKAWEFLHEYYRDKVYYTHGSIGNAFRRASLMRHSVAQGHFHSECFVQWSVSEIDAIFGLQVGGGLDRHAYAFEYGKPMAKKPIISSGLILEKGKLPIVELMKL